MASFVFLNVIFLNYIFLNGIFQDGNFQNYIFQNSIIMNLCFDFLKDAVLTYTCTTSCINIKWTVTAWHYWVRRNCSSSKDIFVETENLKYGVICVRIALQLPLSGRDGGPAVRRADGQVRERSVSPWRPLRERPGRLHVSLRLPVARRRVYRRRRRLLPKPLSPLRHLSARPAPRGRLSLRVCTGLHRWVTATNMST